jgi:hypothetical protein
MVTDMRTAVAGVSELDWRFGPYSFDAIRPSAWDPKQRLVDMDIDFVYAAIIHPNRTDFGLFADADTEFPEFVRAHLQRLDGGVLLG